MHLQWYVILTVSAFALNTLFTVLVIGDAATKFADHAGASQALRRVNAYTDDTHLVYEPSATGLGILRM